MASSETMKQLQDAIKEAKDTNQMLFDLQNKVSSASNSNQKAQQKVTDLRNQLDKELDEEMGLQNTEAKRRGVTVR